MKNDKGVYFKLGIVILSILVLLSFWLTLRVASEPASIVIAPAVSREGEPIIVTFKLNNPLSEPLTTDYQFFANGEFITEGTSTIAPSGSETHKYAYENLLQIGQQVNFLVRTSSNLGEYEKVASSPPYPPQIWSSFVSIASLSTTVMSSMSTMVYYQSVFGSDSGLNIGFICSAVLIILLIFMELNQTLVGSKNTTTLGRLKLRFGPVTWILFIIFLGVFYTRVVFLLVI